MKNLTATICLTLAVLLGSAGMSLSDDFTPSIDSKFYLNACGGNPQSYKSEPLNLYNKIIEVPNIVTKIKTSEYGRPFITEANSSTILPNGKRIHIKLDNLRDLKIIDDDNNILLSRKVTGATSIYELKYNGKTLGWGVGWHKSCKEYYDYVDFTVMRLFVPIIDNDNNIKFDVRLFSIVNSEFSEPTKKSTGLVMVEGSDIYSSGAGSCYYCLPIFYLIDNEHGIVELSNISSLHSKGVDLDKIDPLIHASWLSYNGEIKLLKSFISKNYERIVQESSTYKTFSSLQEKQNLKAYKKSCLTVLREKDLSTKDFGEMCFPGLEGLSYFFNIKEFREELARECIRKKYKGC